MTLYRAGRPNLLAKILNRGWAILHSLGVSPNYLVTLEVVGRRSGNMTSLPLVMTVVNGEPHFPIPPDAPLAAFEAIAAGFPVFRLETTTP